MQQAPPDSTVGTWEDIGSNTEIRKQHIDA